MVWRREACRTRTVAGSHSANWISPEMPIFVGRWVCWARRSGDLRPEGMWPSLWASLQSVWESPGFWDCQSSLARKTGSTELSHTLLTWQSLRLRTGIRVWTKRRESLPLKFSLLSERQLLSLRQDDILRLDTLKVSDQWFSFLGGQDGLCLSPGPVDLPQAAQTEDPEHLNTVVRQVGHLARLTFITVVGVVWALRTDWDWASNILIITTAQISFCPTGLMSPIERQSLISPNKGEGRLSSVTAVQQNVYVGFSIKFSFSCFHVHGWCRHTQLYTIFFFASGKKPSNDWESVTRSSWRWW